MQWLIWLVQLYVVAELVSAALCSGRVCFCRFIKCLSWLVHLYVVADVGYLQLYVVAELVSAVLGSG
jgi:hypothetical protein